VKTSEADVSYYNGNEWIVVEDVILPEGWLVVSPKLAEGK